MTRPDIVRAAIGHREAERVPYLIDFCPDAWELLKPLAGDRSPAEFIDNDVQDFSAPWWTWHGLGPDWRGFEAPTSPPSRSWPRSMPASWHSSSPASGARAWCWIDALL